MAGSVKLQFSVDIVKYIDCISPHNEPAVWANQPHSPKTTVLLYLDVRLDTASSVVTTAQEMLDRSAAPSPTPKESADHSVASRPSWESLAREAWAGKAVRTRQARL